MTNKVTKEKARDLREAHLSCVEITLDSRCCRLMSDKKAFEHFVLFEAPRKWISHKDYSDLKNNLNSKIQSKVNEANEKIKRRLTLHNSSYEQWKEDNKLFCSSVVSYLNNNNRQIAYEKYYESFVSSGWQEYLKNKIEQKGHIFTEELINREIEGDLLFGCHRTIWQWKIVERFLIAPSIKRFSNLNERDDNMLLPSSTQILRELVNYVPASKLLRGLISASERCFFIIKKYKLKENFDFENRDRKWYADPSINSEIKQATYPFLFLKENECESLGKPWLIIEQFLDGLIAKNILLVDSKERYQLWCRVELPE